MSDLAQQFSGYVEGGVARSIEEIAGELGIDYDSLTKAELEEIDSAVFTCELCGWTMPTEEEHDDGESVCRECKEDEE